MGKYANDVSWVLKKNLTLDTTEDGKVKNTLFNTVQFLSNTHYGESGFFYDATSGMIYHDNRIVDSNFVADAILECEKVLGITVSSKRMYDAITAISFNTTIHLSSFEVDGDEFQKFISKHPKYRNITIRYLYNKLYIGKKELDITDYADLEFEFKQKHPDDWERLFNNHVFSPMAKNHQIAKAECYRYSRTMRLIDIN